MNQLKTIREFTISYFQNNLRCSKGSFFDVVLIYRYTLVTNNFIHLDGFKKWEYR